MIDTYQETDEREWLEATVTIDGEVFERAGIRLKGNSSLRGVDDGADPEDLPWLIRLDEFVEGQRPRMERDHRPLQRFGDLAQRGGRT